MQLTLIIWISSVFFFLKKTLERHSVMLCWASQLCVHTPFVFLCIALFYPSTDQSVKPQSCHLASNPWSILRSKGLLYLKYPWYGKGEWQLNPVQRMWTSVSEWHVFLFHFHHLLALWHCVNTISSLNLSSFTCKMQESNTYFRKCVVTHMSHMLKFIVHIHSAHVLQPPSNNGHSRSWHLFLFSFGGTSIFDSIQNLGVLTSYYISISLYTYE